MFLARCFKIPLNQQGRLYALPLVASLFPSVDLREVDLPVHLADDADLISSDRDFVCSRDLQAVIVLSPQHPRSLRFWAYNSPPLRSRNLMVARPIAGFREVITVNGVDCPGSRAVSSKYPVSEVMKSPELV